MSIEYRICFGSHDDFEEALIRAATAIDIKNNVKRFGNIDKLQARQIVCRYQGIQADSIGNNWFIRAADGSGRIRYRLLESNSHIASHSAVRIFPHNFSKKLHNDNINIDWVTRGEGHVFKFIPPDMSLKSRSFKAKSVHPTIMKYALHTEHKIGKYIMGGQEVTIHCANGKYKMNGENHHDQDLLKNIMDKCKNIIVRNSYSFMDHYGQCWIMDHHEGNLYLSIKCDNTTPIKYPGYMTSMFDMESMMESTEMINEEVFYKEAM